MGAAAMARAWLRRRDSSRERARASEGKARSNRKIPLRVRLIAAVRWKAGGGGSSGFQRRHAKMQRRKGSEGAEPQPYLMRQSNRRDAMGAERKSATSAGGQRGFVI